ncbi:MAG: hypothetical protein WCJ30_03345 [Deltaproteobacteria bacterium]
MDPPARFRFDVYGRFTVVVERVDGRWVNLSIQLAKLQRKQPSS